MEIIKRKISVYFSYFKIRFTNAIQYRMVALAGIFTQLAWGAMYIMLYSTFLKNGSSTDMTIAQMSTYIWLQQSAYIVFNSWIIEKDILESIQTGSISMELVKPIDLYDSWHSKISGQKIASWILRAIPLLLITYFLPLGDYGFGNPANFISLVLFIITLILSLLLVMAYVMLMYITAMYTVGTNGVKMIYQLANQFFSGGIMPLSFMPNVMINIIKCTPFYYMQNIPFNIYTGYFNDYKEIVIGILMQIFWTIALTILGRKLVKKRLNKIIIQGG